MIKKKPTFGSNFVKQSIIFREFLKKRTPRVMTLLFPLFCNLALAYCEYFQNICFSFSIQLTNLTPKKRVILNQISQENIIRQVDVVIQEQWWANSRHVVRDFAHLISMCTAKRSSHDFHNKT